MDEPKLEAGEQYEDAEGNVRRIDSIESSAIRYTVIKCKAWPAHVGKRYTAGPKWFASQVVANPNFPLARRVRVR